MENMNFSLNTTMEFKEEKGSIEGVLVNYNHQKLGHNMFRFAKGSMGVNNGKKLHLMYNHNGNMIPVGAMFGVDTENGFEIQAEFNLEKDEGGYINREAAALYIQSKKVPFDLSVGGVITKFSRTQENGKTVVLIEEFKAHEGSITPCGAIEGSKVTKVFNNENTGGTDNMDEKMLRELFAQFSKEILAAKDDEVIKELPNKFSALEKQYSDLKGTLAGEIAEEFNSKFTEINDIIKSLKTDFKATPDEVTAAEEFSAFLNHMGGKGKGVSEEFSTTSEIAFSTSPGTTTTHDKTIKPTYVTKILERLQAANPVLADINFLSITDGSLYVPREMLGLPATGWVGETDSRTETDITGIDNVTIELHQLYALPVVSNRLLATNFVGYINFLLKRVEYALGLALANAALNGSGTKMPKGILKETGIGSAEIDTTSDATFVDSLIGAYYSVRSEISAGAKWYMTRGTWAAIAKLKNSSKNFYITDLNTGNTRTLMTRPVVIIEDENAGLKDVATATATTDPVILFADLGMAMQGIQNNKLNMMIQDQITTKGLTKYYMEKLIGVGTQLPEYAVKIVKKA